MGRTGGKPSSGCVQAAIPPSCLDRLQREHVGLRASRSFALPRCHSIDRQPMSADVGARRSISSVTVRDRLLADHARSLRTLISLHYGVRLPCLSGAGEAVPRSVRTNLAVLSRVGMTTRTVSAQRGSYAASFVNQEMMSHLLKSSGRQPRRNPDDELVGLFAEDFPSRRSAVAIGVNRSAEQRLSLQQNPVVLLRDDNTQSCLLPTMA